MNYTRILLTAYLFLSFTPETMHAGVITESAKVVWNGAKHFFPSTVKKAPLKPYSRTIAKGLEGEVASKGAKVALKEIFESNAESSMKTALNIGAKKLYSATPDFAKPVAKKIIPKDLVPVPAANIGKLDGFLNKRAVNEAKKYLSENEVNILTKDLAKHPKLAQEMMAHPSYIRQYKTLLNAHSPYRVHPSALKYMKSLESRRRTEISAAMGVVYGVGEKIDIATEDRDFEKEIIKNACRDTISLESIANSVQRESPTLMVNKTYYINNQQFKTDSKGRVVCISMDNLTGVGTTNASDNKNIICPQLGGTSNMINCLPSNFEIDLKKKSKFEGQILELAKNNRNLTLKADMVYSVTTGTLKELRYEIYEGENLILDKVFKNQGT